MGRTSGDLEQFLRVSSDVNQVTLSASLKGLLCGRVDFFMSPDGRSAAFAERPEGQLEVVKTGNGAPGYQRSAICSRVLASYLNGQFQPRKGRLPVWYDATARAILLGRAAVDGKTEFSPDSFTRVDIQGIRNFEFCFVDGYVRVSRLFRFRSEAYSNGECLAFAKFNDGSVVLENDGEMCLIRKPEVVAYAKKHWREKHVYARTLEDAIFIAPDIVTLSNIVDMEGFLPLKLDRTMTADMERDYSISLSEEAASALGTRVAVYACGHHLALCSHKGGDLRTDQNGRIRSMALSHQIAVDFPMAARLYLIPHGNLLLLSTEQDLDTRVLPPPSMFCRLLMTQEHTAPPVRYGLYRPTAKAAP